MRVHAPAPRPCESCPYRRDVPSGVWAADEYAKLPGYDRETPFQPVGVFLCHQHNGRVCAGWAGCHDGDELLALRIAAVDGSMTAADIDATIAYRSPVPLFASGAEAAAHGRRDLAEPAPDAQRIATKLARARSGGRL